MIVRVEGSEMASENTPLNSGDHTPNPSSNPSHNHTLDSLSSGVSYHNSGSLSPRSHGSSYPQTPPNSYSVDSGGLHQSLAAASQSGTASLDTQELLSKLDSKVVSETVGENDSDGIQEDSLEGDELSVRVDMGRSDVAGTEEAFELFRKQNEEFLQHMDSIDDVDEDLLASGESETAAVSTSPLKPSANINVDEYLFDLHNENVVASNICQEMMADGVDTSKYQSYISELPNSREEYQRMISKFVSQQSFESSGFSRLKQASAARKSPSVGLITSQAQGCITDPLTTAMLTASLTYSKDSGQPKIEPIGKLNKRQIVDFEVPKFMPTDIDYREPLLATQRECQERNRYLRMVSPHKTPPTRTRLVPSESEQNIKLFDEWQDDEISDLAKNSSVLFTESEDVDIDELRETLDEQKRRLEEEYGIDLDDAAATSNDGSVTTPGVSSNYEFEWDDQELGGGFGASQFSPDSSLRRPTGSVSSDMFDERLVDTSINIQATRRWRTTFINGVEKRIDMKVLDPFKKVLSHGGFTPEGQLILVFSACYMPEKRRPDYKYIIENLFLYVISSLQVMITGDYVLVYLHGGADDAVTPSLNWLKKCYSHIDHRVRKYLQALYLVHPDFWVKTGLKLAKVFTSSKFERKLKFVSSLASLSRQVPIDYIFIPDCVRLLDSQLATERTERPLEGLM